MSLCRVISCIVGRGCLLWPVHPLGKTLLVFALLYFVFQGQSCLLLCVTLDVLLLQSKHYDEKDIFFFFFAAISRRSCRSSQNHSTSSSSPLVVAEYTWIILMLNCFPWKQTLIIQLFLRLHTSTSFWILLLTMRAASLLPRDSCPQ